MVTTSFFAPLYTIIRSIERTYEFRNPPLKVTPGAKIYYVRFGGATKNLVC